VAVDWHAEEKLLWAREMARSKRDFDHDCRLARSRTLIAESRSLLETTADQSEVWAILRIGATGKR
jgi:hypothetical protein